MSNSTYELVRKKSKYKNMKENVMKMINVLSHNNIKDDLSNAQLNLKNYYKVNNSPCKYNDIETQKNKIDDVLLSLKDILNFINYEVNVIDNKILEEEQKESEHQKNG